MTKVELRDLLLADAIGILEKRRARLASRKFVLFPWLRIKWLMRKYSKIEALLKV